MSNEVKQSKNWFSSRTKTEAMSRASATIPTRRTSTSAVWTGSSAFIFGGWEKGGVYSNQIVRYDPTTDKADVMSATLPTGRAGTSAIWDGKCVYIFGGGTLGGGHHYNTNEILRYDPFADKVATMAAALPTGRKNTSAIWDGSNAYVFGGSLDLMVRSSQIVRYNPSNGSVTLMGAKLPTERDYNSAIWDGLNAYVFGGLQGDGLQLNEIVRFNPIKDSVVRMSATLPTGRSNTSAVWDGSRTYLFGGHDGATLDDVVRYDSTADTVTRMATALPTKRGHTSAVWTGSMALIFGGDSRKTLDEIVRYDPAADEATSSRKDTERDIAHVEKAKRAAEKSAEESRKFDEESRKRHEKFAQEFPGMTLPSFRFDVQKKYEQFEADRRAQEEVALAERREEHASQMAERKRLEQQRIEKARAEQMALANQREQETRRAATRQEEARRADLEDLATRIKELRRRRDDLVRRYSTLLVRKIDAALAELPQSGATDAARPLADAAEQILNMVDDRLQRRSQLQRRSAEIQKEHRGLSARLGKGELGQASFDRAYQALDQEKGDIDNDMDQLDAELFEDRAEKPV